MKVIVGLGNPGSRYAKTRHNVGFKVIDRLADMWQIGMDREKFHAWYGHGVIDEESVALLKPTTFMNRSGQAVAAAVRFHQVAEPDLLVISDDIALPCGRIRLKPGGSAGGHNGLQDVIDRTGSNGFARLRVGVDAPMGDQVSYVLSPFAPDERPIMDRAVERAAQAVACWMADGMDRAMNRFNASEEV